MINNNNQKEELDPINQKEINQKEINQEESLTPDEYEQRLRTEGDAQYDEASDNELAFS